MRICLVGSTRFPIAEPFAGGLEAMTHVLARGLAARGHDVTLFAGPGSDPALPVRVLPISTFVPSVEAMRDVNAPSTLAVAEHHAYLSLMLDLSSGLTGPFDVVHNNSLHHLPVAMAPAIPVPVVTTLHTPPLALMESALHLAPGWSTFTAVSDFIAGAWEHVVPSTVIRNGLDLEEWPLGAGGGPAVWSGRLVAEKAPHEAIAACRRAGVPLVVAGPVHDSAFFDSEIRPLLGSGVEYAGHLRHDELARVLGEASVAVVTPAWEEPYGLVAAEAMACGTPVAGYARGALPEVVGDDGGMLVRPGDVGALAAAVDSARALDRRVVRGHAELTCSATRMIDEYEQCFAVVTGGTVAA